MVRTLVEAAFLCSILLISGCKEAIPPVAEAAAKVAGDRISLTQAADSKGALPNVEVKRVPPPPIALSGRVIWDEDHTARLYPAYAGKVTRILVNLQDHVKAGQPLALLGSPDFGQAQAEAKRAEADYGLAMKNIERVRALYEHDVVALKDLQAAESDVHKAESELHRTRARLKLYGSEGGLVDQNFPLRSPIDGIVVEKNINPGQELRPDLATSNAPAMFVVTDPKRLWVQLDAAEKDLPLLIPGQIVRVRSAVYADEVFPAKVEVVADTVDPISRTIKVRCSLANPERKLKGEMFVTAELDSQGPARLEVPSKAVLLRGDKHYVFVTEKNSEVIRKEVRIIPALNDNVVVLNGLQDGQRVVVEGSLQLQQLMDDKKTDP